MKELKTLNMGTNMIMLKDSKVTSSILPKNTAELQQNITVDENVIIEGAVYTNVLEINNGPAEFKGAVFANQEIYIKNDFAGEAYFMKAVASSASIVSILGSGRCIYGSDINSPTIKLKNCFVCGSVYGTDITLENCVVLGGVFSSKNLEINSCVIGTFNLPSVKMGGINYLLYSTAFSVEPISIMPGTELWNISLADLASLFKGEEEMPNTGKLKVDLQNDTQRTVLTAEDGTQTLINSYSVSSRVLVSDLVDYDKLKNHFLIISASLGTQLQKDYTLPMKDGQEGPALSVQKIGDFFFDVLSGKIAIKEISGEIAFDELKKKYD